MKAETTKGTNDATRVGTADVQKSLFNAASFKDFLLDSVYTSLTEVV